jgi:purine-binding chemotaxis protein CheW
VWAVTRLVNGRDGASTVVTVRHVVFRLERDRYALPLSAIREVVVAPEAYTRVPRAPAPVKGVMNLRGRVVPVVDLRELLGLTPSGPGSRVVLLDLGRRELGLLITEVDGIESIEKVAASTVRTGPMVKGLARLGALAITVLDPAAVDAEVARSFTSR